MIRTGFRVSKFTLPFLMARGLLDMPRYDSGARPNALTKPGFPIWLPPVADDGSTEGVPARIRP